MAKTRYTGASPDQKASPTPLPDKTVLRGNDLQYTRYGGNPAVAAVEVRIGSDGTRHEYPIYNRQTAAGLQASNSWRQARDQNAGKQGTFTHNNLRYANVSKVNAGGGSGGNKPADTVTAPKGSVKGKPTNALEAQNWANKTDFFHKGTKGPGLNQLQQKYGSPLENSITQNPILGRLAGFLGGENIPNRYNNLISYSFLNSPQTNQEIRTYEQLKKAKDFDPKTKDTSAPGPQILEPGIGDNLPILQALMGKSFGYKTLKNLSVQKQLTQGTPLALPPASTIKHGVQVAQQAMQQAAKPVAQTAQTVQTVQQTIKRGVGFRPKAQVPVAPARQLAGFKNIKPKSITDDWTANIPGFRQGGIVVRYANGGGGQSTYAFDHENNYNNTRMPGLGSGQSFIQQTQRQIGATPDGVWGPKSQSAYMSQLQPMTYGSVQNSMSSVKPTLAGVTPRALPAATTGSNVSGLNRYLPQRDTVGYAMDAAKVIAGLIPTKNAPAFKPQNLNSTIRPVGINEAAYETSRNELSQNNRVAGRTIGSDLNSAVMGRYAANAQMNQGITQLGAHRAEALQNDTNRYAQQLNAQEMYNNQLQNGAGQYNNQQQQMAVAGAAQAKNQMLNSGLQNIETRRATENSQANIATTQAAYGTIMQQNQQYQKRVNDLAAELASGKYPYGSPQWNQLNEELKRVTAEANNIGARTNAAHEQLGWRTAPVSRAKGGRLPLADQLVLDNHKNQNQMQRDALKYIRQLQSQVLNIAAKAGIPRRQISRYR